MSKWGEWMTHHLDKDSNVKATLKLSKGELDLLRCRNTFPRIWAFQWSWMKHSYTCKLGLYRVYWCFSDWSLCWKSNCDTEALSFDNASCPAPRVSGLCLSSLTKPEKENRMRLKERSHLRKQKHSSDWLQSFIFSLNCRKNLAFTKFDV